jgi:hypothetical protein
MTGGGIFISYKREDLAAVQQLVQGLRDEGLSVWWDQDIAPDAPWEATIERELKAAKVVIVAWSAAAVDSENVKAEARYARTQGKLIQVFVQRCAPPLFFGERQGVDLSGWSGYAKDRRFQTVLDAVRALLAGRRPKDGVGYAPRKLTPWGVLGAIAVGISTVLGIVANAGGARDAVCSIGPLTRPCTDWGLIPIAETPAPIDPAAVLAAERERLLSQLNGRWARGDVDPLTGRPRDCSQSLTIEILTDEAGVERVRLTAEGFESQDQVETAADGMVRVSGRDADGVLVEGRYEPAGDRLTFASGGTSTLLHRCP